MVVGNFIVIITRYAISVPTHSKYYGSICHCVIRSIRVTECQTFSDLCQQVDGNLFDNITGNNRHLLYPLLPPVRSQHYSLRQRSHDFHIPTRTSTLIVNNFLIRMLFKDTALSSIRSCISSYLACIYVTSKLTPIHLVRAKYPLYPM